MQFTAQIRDFCTAGQFLCIYPTRMSQYIRGSHDESQRKPPARRSAAYSTIKYPKRDFFLLHRVSLAHSGAQAVHLPGCLDFKMRWKRLSVIISHLTLYFLSCSSLSADVLFSIQRLLSGLCWASEARSTTHKTGRRQSAAFQNKKKKKVFFQCSNMGPN